MQTPTDPAAARAVTVEYILVEQGIADAAELPHVAAHMTEDDYYDRLFDAITAPDPLAWDVANLAAELRWEAQEQGADLAWRDAIHAAEQQVGSLITYAVSYDERAAAQGNPSADYLPF